MLVNFLPRRSLVSSRCLRLRNTYTSHKLTSTRRAPPRRSLVPLRYTRPRNTCTSHHSPAGLTCSALPQRGSLLPTLYFNLQGIFASHSLLAGILHAQSFLGGVLSCFVLVVMAAGHVHSAPFIVRYSHTTHLRIFMFNHCTRPRDRLPHTHRHSHIPSLAFSCSTMVHRATGRGTRSHRNIHS